MEKTLGGDRIGSGAGMKQDLHEYGRSTHRKSYITRTTRQITNNDRNKRLETNSKHNNTMDFNHTSYYE